MGARVLLTDLPDRLKLLKKNVEVNVKGRNARGSAEVCELTWGDDLDAELTEPPPDYGKRFLLNRMNKLLRSSLFQLHNHPRRCSRRIRCRLQ